MSPRLRHLFTLLTASLAALGLLFVVPASAGADPSVTYVALGDSFASGPLIPHQRADPPVGCMRSDHGYPTLVATGLRVANFVDATCGGAQTKDMTGPQPVTAGTNPPQFDALTRDTDLVTLTISGNDIGYTEILRACVGRSITDPFGNPCQRHYTSGGTDQLAARIAEVAKRVTAVLDGIRQRAPLARVVVVGYLRILPPSVGCWPVLPIATGDVPYLDQTQLKLNAMLAERARTAGALFVDPGATIGHDACQIPSRKWVEGLVPTSAAAPVHPNAAGMAEVARLVLENLRSTHPRA